jgi:hypothetical protein
MNINQGLISVNFSPGRYGQTVRNIVLHTMVGTIAGSQSRFQSAASQVSAHYGVAETGEIRQWVSEGNTAWQAGNWDVNISSIGIEHEDLDNPNDAIRTEALYASSAVLVANICRRYGLPCELVATTNFTPDGPGIVVHKQVDSMAGGTACPDGLDVNRIVNQAQAILSASVIATAPTAAVHSQFAVATFNESVTVNITTLDVRSGPGTNYEGSQANTPDGMVHDGNTVQIIGYTAGQDVDYSGSGGKHTDIWLKTLNALGQSHYIWAGGTNFTLPAPAAIPAPPVVEPAPAPATEAVVAPAPEVAPVVEAPVVEPTPVPVVPALTSTNGTAALASTAVITDLSTGKPIAQVPAQTLDIVGSKQVNGVLYLVTEAMAKAGLDHGIASSYFKQVDGITAKSVPILEEIGGVWNKVLKFLHLS